MCVMPRCLANLVPPSFIGLISLFYVRICVYTDNEEHDDNEIHNTSTHEAADSTGVDDAEEGDDENGDDLNGPEDNGEDDKSRNGETSPRYPRRRVASRSIEDISHPLLATSPIDGKELKVKVRFPSNSIDSGSEVGSHSLFGSSPRLGGRGGRGRGGRGREFLLCRLGYPFLFFVT